MEIIILPKHVHINYNSLWDGTTRFTSPGTLLIKEGRVAAYPGIDLSTIPELDLSAYSLLPALIDCHVHLALPYEDTDIPTKVRGFLHSGVAAVRDAGSKNGETWRQVQQLRVVPSICGISKKNYYGDNLGKQISSVDEAGDMIAQFAATGAKQIKVVASGIFSFTRYAETGPIPFTEAELAYLVKIAAEYDLPVFAHASGDEAIRRCITAGIFCIEHGYFISAETLQLMAEKQVFWVPTLAPVAAWLNDEHNYAALTPAAREVVKRSLEQHQQMVAKGQALGVTIGAGTDAGAPGVPHGASLLSELSLFGQCGLSPLQALRTATINAAKICGLSDLGELTVNKSAAMLAVRGNPLEDIESLQNPAYLLLPHTFAQPGHSSL